jgi:hypothetical protein
MGCGGGGENRQLHKRKKSTWRLASTEKEPTAELMHTQIEGKRS